MRKSVTHAATTLEIVHSAHRLRTVLSVTQISLPTKISQHVKHAMIVSTIVKSVLLQVHVRDAPDRYY